MTPSCINCQFYRRPEGQPGQVCSRFPKHEQHGPSDWCGEYAPRPEFLNQDPVVTKIVAPVKRGKHGNRSY